MCYIYNVYIYTYIFTCIYYISLFLRDIGCKRYGEMLTINVSVQSVCRYSCNFSESLKLFKTKRECVSDVCQKEALILIKRNHPELELQTT